MAQIMVTPRGMCDQARGSLCVSALGQQVPGAPNLAAWKQGALTWYGLRSSFQSPGISGSARESPSQLVFPGSPWTDSLEMATSDRGALGCAAPSLSCHRGKEFSS